MLGEGATRYAYDNRDRLTRITTPDGNIVSYTYDAAGNRLNMTVDGRTTSYSYNTLDQMLTAGTTAFSYDGRGNLTGIVGGADTTTYAFDAADRLVGATLPDGTSVRYCYDADGRRVEKTVGSQETNYLWDEASAYGDVIQETDGGGAPLASYVLGGTELLSQTRGGVTSYYLHDAQGSVRGLVDSGGTLTDTYSYAAFGDLFAQTGSTANAYLYTGQQFDALTGLYSLRARYYDPALGRFLSRDAAEIELSNPRELNRYVYAANSPINLADPSGLQTATERGLLGLTLTIAASPAGQVGFVAAGSLAMMYVAWLVREPVRAPARPGWPDTTNPNPGENPFGTPPQWERTPEGPPAWRRIVAIVTLLSIVGAEIKGSRQGQVEGEPAPERVEPTPTPERRGGFSRTIDRARTNPKNYTIRPGRNERGLSTYSDRVDPQCVLLILGKDRLIQIPSDDPVILSLGLTWLPTKGNTGDPILDANHWELSLVSDLADQDFVQQWNQTIASALAAEAIRWTEIRRVP